MEQGKAVAQERLATAAELAQVQQALSENPHMDEIRKRIDGLIQRNQREAELRAMPIDRAFMARLRTRRSNSSRATPARECSTSLMPSSPRTRNPTRRSRRHVSCDANEVLARAGDHCRSEEGFTAPSGDRPPPAYEACQPQPICNVQRDVTHSDGDAEVIFQIFLPN